MTGKTIITCDTEHRKANTSGFEWPDLYQVSMLHLLLDGEDKVQTRAQHELALGVVDFDNMVVSRDLNKVCVCACVCTCIICR